MTYYNMLVNKLDLRRVTMNGMNKEAFLKAYAEALNYDEHKNNSKFASNKELDAVVNEVAMEKFSEMVLDFVLDRQADEIIKEASADELTNLLVNATNTVSNNYQMEKQALGFGSIGSAFESLMGKAKGVFSAGGEATIAAPEKRNKTIMAMIDRINGKTPVNAELQPYLGIEDLKKALMKEIEDIAKVDPVQAHSLKEYAMAALPAIGFAGTAMSAPLVYSSIANPSQEQYVNPLFGAGMGALGGAATSVLPSLMGGENVDLMQALSRAGLGAGAGAAINAYLNSHLGDVS
jgi:hypothetical protein